MPAKTALIYSPELDSFCYGEAHPFKVQRYQLAYDLMRSYGLADCACLHRCGKVTDDQLLSFHSADYLNRLKEFSSADGPRADFNFGLGDAENPVFKGVYDWACISTAGTVEAARLLVDEGYDRTFNLAGGWHHAHRNKASGFSYLNDAVIAINMLLSRGKRVVYLDLDAHHGDGVQEAFYDTNQVLTISIHQSGVYFFPGTGFEQETGHGKGTGYTVNVPLLEHTDDALYMKAFDEIAFPLIAAFDPDVLVTQLGADTFRTDPLTKLEITTHAYSYVVKKLRALSIPWLAVGGGGYDQMNVARAWTIVWAAMNDVELHPALPPEFVDRISILGFPHKMLLDAMHWADDDDRNRALDAIEKSISTIRQNIFPIIIGSYGKTSGK